MGIQIGSYPSLPSLSIASVLEQGIVANPPVSFCDVLPAVKTEDAVLENCIGVNHSLFSPSRASPFSMQAGGISGYHRFGAHFNPLRSLFKPVIEAPENKLLIPDFAETMQYCNTTLPDYAGLAHVTRSPVLCSEKDPFASFDLAQLWTDIKTGHLFYAGKKFSYTLMRLESLVSFIEKFKVDKTALKALLKQRHYFIYGDEEDGNRNGEYEEHTSSCEISLGESLQIKFTLKKEMFSYPELCVDLCFPSQKISLSYDATGFLIYKPGEMFHFYSAQYPSVADPKNLRARFLPYNAGGVLQQKLLLTDDNLGIYDLADCLQRAVTDRPETSRLTNYLNLIDVTLSLSNQERRRIGNAEMVRHYKIVSPELVHGVRTSRNPAVLSHEDVSISLDRIAGIELSVSANDAQLTVPTHTIWQEMERLNEIGKQTKQLCYFLGSLQTGYYINIFVYDARDREWKYYSSLFFDNYGQRYNSYEEEVTAIIIQNKFIAPSLTTGFSSFLREQQMEHALFYAHTLSEKTGNAEHDCAVAAYDWMLLDMAPFFQYLQNDENGFFRGVNGKDVLTWKGNTEVLNLSYVSFYVTEDVIAVIREFMSLETVPARKEELRLLLLDRFSFVPTSHVPACVTTSLVDAQIKINDRMLSVLYANRIHDRYEAKISDPSQREDPAITVMFHFEEGREVTPEGQPAGGSGTRDADTTKNDREQRGVFVD